MVNKFRATWKLGFLLFTLFQHQISQSQDFEALSDGHYVVIGTFSKEANARKFMKDIEQDGYRSKLAKENYHYVYLNHCSSKDIAVRLALAVQKKFDDVWVKSVGVTSNSYDDSLKIDKVTATDNSSLQNLKIFVRLLNAATSQEVKGEVDVLDSGDLRLLKVVKANRNDTLRFQLGESANVTMISDVFGYHKVRLDTNLTSFIRNSASANNVKNPDNSVKIDVRLIPYRTGEMITLQEVFFYKNAAIMQPESIKELNELVQWLMENKKMKIRLHGHTNGGHRGKIIETKARDSFFYPTDSVIHRGSAKTLSFKRADLIKRFLVTNAVDKSRIEVKAWGGKRALYDKHGNEAYKNIRVDVEIIKE